MKRGFLISPKAKTGPQGTTTPAVAPKKISANFSIGKQNVEVPKGYDVPTHFKERDPRLGSSPEGMTITTVPFVDAVPGEPVTECLFHPGTKEVLMNLPGFSQPMVQPATCAFRMAEAPGKGFGLFSTRALEAGELIFSDRPLLVCAQGISKFVPDFFTREQYLQASLNHQEQLMSKCVERMDPQTKAAYMALANSHQEDGSGPLVGILRTNGLGLPGLRPGVTGAAGMYVAVCKDIARINHSCSPNIHPHWDVLSFSYQLFAVRDIPAGEELTFQYVDIECSTAGRNEALKPYDFICTCTSCKDPSSDGRRAELVESDTPSVTEWVCHHAQADGWLLAECRRQLELIEREGLETMPRHFEVLAAGFVACVVVGDTKGASEWAAKLAKFRWQEQVRRNIELFLDPESPAYQAHPLWRLEIDRDGTKSPEAMMRDLEELVDQASENAEGF